jgi:hypothetical protein
VAAESSASNDPGQHQPVEALIDELISEILNSSDAAQSAKSAGRGRSPSPAGLLDTVRSTMTRTAGGASTLERLLVAEALAGMLADAIAPALAEVLAPRIMKALEATGEAETKTPAARSHATERSRKSDAK